MDALSQILEVIKHKGVVYEKIDFSAPWGIELPNDNNAQFWRLLKGTCFLTVPGEATINLKEGDLVLVPNGASHWIADNPASARIPAADFLKARDSGHHLFTGPGDQTIMIGGHFEFDSNPRPYI
jgi:quercetin dioxygenase-like cupin family protein